MLYHLILLPCVLAPLVVTGAQIATPRSTAASPEVTLDYGTFVGLSDAATGITKFLGIRYADSPTGDLRWRAPVSPPTNNLGRVDATKFANACVSASQTKITSGTSEDCLFGNVYVPTSAQASGALPVLVWFHGGGFQGGSTHDISPNPILKSKAFVFVSFEYRLGQFGFLGGTAIKEDGSLNSGLLDQRAALRWVQRYISKFGGDAKSVTIWGQSAGAGSTMFHLLGNGGDNEGLFRAAMGDSPSLNFLPSYTDPYVQGIFDQVSGFAGCANSTSEDVMSCLRSVDGNLLASAGSKTISARTSTLFTFAPIIDGGFLVERPVEAFTNGNFSRVPVLFGANADDGAHWSASLPDPDANTSTPNATETTVYNFLKGQWASLTRPSFDKAVSDFYPSADYANFSLQGQQMYGEMRYICTAGLIAGAAAQQGLGGYHFFYSNPILGSFHSDELAAFFSSSATDKEDTELFDTMKDYWRTFVVSGAPSTGNQAAAAWTSSTTTPGSPEVLLQPGNIVVENISEDKAARCAFWHGISEELKV